LSPKPSGDRGKSTQSSQLGGGETKYEVQISRSDPEKRSAAERLCSRQNGGDDGGHIFWALFKRKEVLRVILNKKKKTHRPDMDGTP